MYRSTTTQIQIPPAASPPLSGKVQSNSKKVKTRRCTMGDKGKKDKDKGQKQKKIKKDQEAKKKKDKQTKPV
jgi:hypothetical protein